MSPDSLVPVPELIQRRAWECAVMLIEDFSDRFGPGMEAYFRELAARDLGSLTWHDTYMALHGWSRVVEVRR